MVASWFRNLVARSNRHPVRKPASTPTERRARLNVEALEDRRLMSGVPSSLGIPALGNLTVPLGPNSVTVDTSGNLVSADVHINSGSFNVAGVKFGVHDLEVQYTAATQEFDIRGTASASIGDTNGITATFGSPDTFGIVLVNNGQTLQSLSGSLSLTKPLIFNPATLTLSSASVDYFPKTGDLELGGSASLTTARNGPTLSVALGDASSETKGIVIHNGRLTALNATVNGSFATAGLSVAANNMTLSYSNQGGQTFDISGRADLTVAGNQFHITVPTNGIVIQNGVLQSLTASVDGDVRVGKAASLSLRNASVSYSRKQDQLAFWGGVQQWRACGRYQVLTRHRGGFPDAALGNGPWFPDTRGNLGSSRRSRQGNLDAGQRQDPGYPRRMDRRRQARGNDPGQRRAGGGKGFRRGGRLR